MAIVRLQTIVSREVAPGEIAVVTVGSVQAGTRSNLIPDHALLELNLRSYSGADPPAHARVGPADRAGREPGLRLTPGPGLRHHRQLPAHGQRAGHDGPGGQRVAAHFGDHAGEIDRQTVSEDFSNIPNAAGVPYTYWALGYTDEKTYRAAEKAGRLQDLTSNHSPKFLPPLQPCLRTGTEALTTAALAWLARK